MIFPHIRVSSRILFDKETHYYHWYGRSHKTIQISRYNCWSNGIRFNKTA